MDYPTWDGVLLAVAAVLAAGIAAITAILRQRQQLNAESERLHRQLAHDRQLREEEETRSVLDDALRAAGLAIDTTSEFLSNSLLNRAREEAGLEPQPLDAGEIVGKARIVLVGLGAQGQRLRLRFGEEHELFASYQDLLFTMQAVVAAQVEAMTGEQGSEMATETAQEAGDRLREFGEVSRKYAGVGLPS